MISTIQMVPYSITVLVGDIILNILFHNESLCKYDTPNVKINNQYAGDCHW